MKDETSSEGVAAWFYFIIHNSTFIRLFSLHHLRHFHDDRRGEFHERADDPR